ncbi:double-cubane-cluster-containing anaerobic reductase [Nitrosophilus alvini]|uniref:double-cubane-cluster-containing anaerobic reductase n=1 Tax=Nitrosophilus alvini TaxID=2714855 RepID=UPI001909ADF3|nr:double-cubane-cluster-containing anaerobic reductase [Nitrosophilus alvini]
MMRKIETNTAVQRKREIEDPQKRHSRHEAMEAVQMLDKLKYDFPHSLESMKYFYDLYERVYCKGEKIHSDKPLVGTLCIQVPYEIIYAMDAVPVRLCNGFHTDEQLGGEFMPTKSCSLVKATLGMLQSRDIPAADKLDIIVHPTTCDQKTKAISIIEDMSYDMYHMEFPRVKESEESREYWRRTVRKFTKDISKELGRKVSRRSLKEAIRKVGRAQMAYHKLNELRRVTPSPILGKDMFLITNAFFFDEIERWTEAVENVYEEVKKRVQSGFNAAGKRSPRILYTGSPPIFPNLKLPVMIEEADGIIVADESCSANRLLNDMVSVDEWFMYDMVDAIADRYLKGCTCPIFTKNEDRKRRLRELIEEYCVDGVVYQSFAGCQVYEMEQRSIMQEMEKINIPMLYVETDYSPGQGGQLSTRVEAFIESLKVRRRKR